MIDTHMHKNIIYETMPALRYMADCGTVVIGFETDDGWYGHLIEQDVEDGECTILTTISEDSEKEFLDELNRRFGKKAAG